MALLIGLTKRFNRFIERKFTTLSDITEHFNTFYFFRKSQFHHDEATRVAEMTSSIDYSISRHASAPKFSTIGNVGGNGGPCPQRILAASPSSSPTAASSSSPPRGPPASTCDRLSATTTAVAAALQTPEEAATTAGARVDIDVDSALMQRLILAERLHLQQQRERAMMTSFPPPLVSSPPPPRPLSQRPSNASVDSSSAFYLPPVCI